MLLRGHIRTFVFYDVGEAFELDKLRTLLGSRGGATKADFPRRTPDYVRFENPPIAEPNEPLTLRTGEHVIYSIKYYEYAIVEVQLEVAIRRFLGSVAGAGLALDGRYRYRTGNSRLC